MKIELLGVCKGYWFTKALIDVSLTIDPGQIVAVVGANGAGKTTLMRCLAGLLVPDRGEIRYDGEPFRRDRIDLRRRLAFLPDFPITASRWDLVSRIALAVRLYGIDPAGIEEKAAGLLQEFDLLEKEDAHAGELSRGQAYKAGLVSVLAVDPELWLLDEPLASGMDPHGIMSLKRYVRAAAERGRTIVYTTQILDVAESFADRICIVDAGRVQAFGEVQQLLARSDGQRGSLESLFDRLRSGDKL